MRSMRVAMALSIVMLAALLSVPTMAVAQGPVVLDFSTGTAGTGGTLTITGSQAKGSGILIDTLTVSGTAGSPMVLNVDGTGPSTGSSNGSTGLLNFDTAANTVTITGSVPALGIGQTTLLQGTFASISIIPLGTTSVLVRAAGPDFKNGDLLKALGIPFNVPFSFLDVTIGASGSGGIYSVTSTDFGNTAACKSQIGDFVWNDLNHNGVQDAGESGISNITVQLWDSTHTTLLATSVTNTNGIYGFSGVCANTYQVEIPPQAGLTGWVASPTGGGIPATDSNPNPSFVTVPDNSADLTIDFGFYYVPPLLRVVKTPDGHTADGGTFLPGAPVSFQIKVYNDGAAPATNVKLDDQLPGGGGLMWMLAPLSPSQGSCTISASNNLHCDLLTILGGQSATVTLVSAQNPVTACRDQYNPVALATADGNLSAQDSGDLICSSTSLSTKKVDPSTTVAANTPVTITVTETNTSGSPISNVFVTGTGCTAWKPVGVPDANLDATKSIVLSLGAGASVDFACTFTPANTTPWTATAYGKDQNGNDVPLTGESTGGTVTVTVTADCVTIVAVQGVAITPVTMVGSGGTGTGYTFSATGLPAGLTMSANGTISGTPTVSGTFNYTVTITDSAGNVGTVNCSVTVNPPPTANCVTIVAVQGVAITPVTMVGSGGTGTGYTFSATGLPAGLSMSTGGTISGTPTVSGTFNYTVTVKDSAGNTGTVNCSVTVNPPPTADCVAIVAVQGVAITPVTMVGSGGVGGPYTFSATGLPAGLSMSTGGTISGTPTVSGTFNYTVTVTDSAGNTGTVNCSVTVNPPPTANCVTIVAVQGVAITPVTMVGSGGVGGPYTFSATGLPAGLSMSTGGTISGTPTVSGTFNYTVTVKDSAGNTGTVNCSVTVNPPPTADCVAIVAVQGVAITPVTMVGSGGVGGPYTFSATGLPAGLSMSTGGTISGTPTVSGTFNYTVTVKDSAGNTGTVNCSVTVNPPPTANCVTIVAVQGVAITPVTMVGSGGAGGPYTFSATGLPAGLSMSTGGTISGTPTVSGTFNYTVTVKDSAGNTGTVNCSVTVNPPPTANCVTIVAVQGVAITPVTMVGSGGAGGPYTFTATGLPAGLSMSTSGTISGTPTVSGTFNYTVTVKDSAGNTGTVNCSVTVNPPPTANCVTIVAVQGVAITPVTMVGSGGAGGPYTFSATGLPAGLSMSTSGTISGTPTVSGTFNYTVTVKDSAGNTGTVNCSVTVGPPPSANCVTIVAIQGVAITPVTMVGSGGVGGPYTFSATGLPAGLSMSTSGTISGTPTVSGTFNYTVTVKDSAGNTGTVNCSVTVGPPPSANCVTIVAIQGVAITPVTMVGSGGVGGPYTFSATGLPAGLSMSTSGTISGTPTVSGTFNYTVTVKDSAGNTGTVNCSVTVQPPPPPLTLTCPPLTSGVVGVFFTTKVTAVGGTAPYKYSIAAGSLPTGLSLDMNTGVISGTPTVAGSFSFTIQVQDATTTIALSTCSTSCGINTATWNFNSPTGVLGTSQNYTMNGLTITATGYNNDGTKRALYGKDLGGDESGLGIYGTTADQEIDVNTFIQLDLANVIAAGATNAQMIVNSVQMGETYNIYGSNTSGVVGTLLGPPNRTLDNTAFAIPSFGMYRYVSVRATYADVLLGAVSFSLGNCQITISSTPTATCVAINAVQGVAITPVTLTGSGGTGGPYTFSATGLPAGLSLSTSGTISGTPTVSGTFNYTVTVKDKDGNTGTFNCSVTVKPPAPSATCVTINAVQGIAITPVTMTGSGGAGGPYTFSATGLPAGLTMSTSGTISGTPTVSGTFNYTVTIKDKDGNTGTINCSVTVNPPSVVCVPSSFDFSGNSASTGTAGNIRTFTGSNGVQVKASAFNRTTGGTWSTAYLGSYSPGLGVTNNTESGNDPTHKVDNVGSVDYVLFEFSSPVIVDQALLDAVTTDSDISVWIGNKTNAFNSHQTLSDSFLTSLGFMEENLTDSSATRWADFNGGSVQGNILVISALASDTSPEDQFKIHKITTTCPQQTVCSGKIGDYVWKDTNGNGIQDAGEVGIAGVTVQLKSGSTVVATTTTNSSGWYQFTGLCKGTYTVVIPTTPTGYTASPSLAGTNRSLDSNGSPATVTLPADDSSDQTIDFGFIPPAQPCVVSTFDFSGNTASTGSAGNIRSFTSTNGLQVKVSAFHRTTTGAWSSAYLGSYSPGLGVTNNFESGNDPTHKVDNVSGVDYVLFEFASPVIIDKAYLDAVTTDSDMTVWIGNKTNPFTNHQTLSDSFLTGLGYVEENLTDTSDARWADFNGGALQGNILVISALASDTSPEDYFKIHKLQTACPQQTACSGKIGDKVWKDTNLNGIQDAGEPGIAGVTVQLKNGSTVLATTTTDANGAYQFTGLCAGTYSVVIPTPPAGYTSTPSSVGTNKAVDSNGSPATVTLSASNSSDLTIDFGFVPGAAQCAAGTITLTGNSPSSGTAANIRTFSANGVNVHTSAFSRTTGGSWSTAYLGAYGPGLGVTNNNESGADPTHKVDNIDGVDFVLFEFSTPVILNQVFLDSVGDDSDVSVWIGSKSDPYNNHQTLSDAFLGGLPAHEENLTSTVGSRWADINSANKSGNLIVVSALSTDTSPEDAFKISKLEIKCQ